MFYILLYLALFNEWKLVLTIFGSCKLGFPPTIRYQRVMLLFFLLGALVAWVYKTGNFEMESYVAFLWGGGQAFLLFIISFTRIPATL